VLARLIWNYSIANGANYVDLHVYVDGAATIARGGLYQFVYRPVTPAIALEFTYPPFAALVFYPLHFLPFGLVGFCWQLGVVAAFYGCAALSLRMLGRPDRRAAMAWTAVAVWIEPARHTFELDQINVLLMFAVLWAVYSNRTAVSGLLVGLAAGIKLTPAIAGLYFLGMRRWAAAGAAGLVFVATIAVSVLVLGRQGRYFFTDLLGDAHRVGIVASPGNQSLRGVIGYTLGYDPSYAPVTLAAIAATAALAVLAWRALDDSDRLGRILVVMLVGLLVSPVSWTHHWVWILPLVLWLIYGPLRTAAAGWAWLVLALVGPPWLMTVTDSHGWTHAGDPIRYVAGSAYVLATLLTLAYLAMARRRSDLSSRPVPDPVG